MISRFLALLILPIIAYYFVKEVSRRFNFTPRQTRLLFLIVAALLVVAVLIVLGRLPVGLILAPLGAAAAEQTQFSGENTSVPDEGRMDHQLAIEVLGLTEPINKEDVIQAHRKLMQKLHPDRGGSDYLAKKINTAKDFLLNELE